MNTSFLFQPFPIIDIGDIVLREISQNDAPEYYQYMSMPEMHKLLVLEHCPNSVEKAADDLKYWRNLFTAKTSIYWALALQNTNKMIGTIGFNLIDFHGSRADISYDLNPQYWGQGIMLKAIKKLLRYVDSNIGINRIQATVFVRNPRSIILLERCGFKQEAVLEKYEIINNVAEDYYMYARVI